jgi:hypothetical protein
MKKHVSLVLLAMMLALVASTARAGQQMYQGEGGQGYQVEGDYATAPDADGDGIPNCQDPDYTPPADGTGSQFGKPHTISTGVRLQASNWLQNSYMWMGGFGPFLMGLLSSGAGPGDGTGDGIPNLDGTGYGPGDCTGDGIPDYDGDGGKVQRKLRP